MLEGTAEIDWETCGQQAVRNEVSGIAERWHWPAQYTLRLPVRVRRSYWYRVREYAEREKQANKR